MNFTFTDSGYTETNKNNPPTIFVHGFFMNNEMFKYQFDELKEKHRVVCINVRGFDAPSEKTEPFSLYDIVDDILNVADSLQLDKFILGGGCRWGVYIITICPVTSRAFVRTNPYGNSGRAGPARNCIQLYGTM